MPLILAALALSLAMVLASCGDSGGGGMTVQNTQGRLEISGLGAFGGYRIFAIGAYSNGDFIMLNAFGPSGLTGSMHNPTHHGALISGDTVTLHLWEVDIENFGLLGFRGGIVPDDFDVYIVSRDISALEMEAILDYLYDNGPRPAFFVAYGELTGISTSGHTVSGAFQASP